jgi:hypothetical protein
MSEIPKGLFMQTVGGPLILHSKSLGAENWLAALKLGVMAD